MLGLIYLFLCFYLGGVLVEALMPSLLTGFDKTFEGKALKHPVPSYFIRFPAYFTVGAVISGWCTYLLGYLFQHDAEPLKRANGIWMVACTVFCVLMTILLWQKEKKKTSKTSEVSNASDSFIHEIVSSNETESDEKMDVPTDSATENKEESQSFQKVLKEFLVVPDLIYFLMASVLVMTIMYASFFWKDGYLRVGWTNYSDFAPHLAMIRSFSFSNNFPTTYAHFGGVDIRYHFLFQFLAGNLEYLGMRIDWAFNSISMISLIGEYLLLYALAVKLTGSRFIGFLAGVFLSFRSSFAFFEYMATIPKGSNIWQTLLDNLTYVGFTEHEDWGLWNLNVYINQRHLAIGICLLLIAVLALSNRLFESGGLKTLFKKQGWIGPRFAEAVFIGIVLGLGSFFNGACVIAALLVLFVIALFSDHRLDFLVIAVLTVVLTKLESMLFMKANPMEFEYYYGFLAANRTFFGAIDYLIRMMGALPIVLLAAFVLQNRKHRVMIAAFSLPIVFAFTVKMSIEVTANHKYIFISMGLLGIYSAYVIWQLVRSKDVLRIICAVLLSLVLTITGLYDFYELFNKNSYKAGRMAVYNMNDPMIEWVHENATSQDLFLTYWHTTNAVTLGGGSLFLGWPYFAWSAGYDTFYRRDEVKLMYEASSPEELDALIHKHNIRFILVDSEVRNSPEYEVNEENIKNTYECVYSSPLYDAQIYDTTKMCR